MNMLLLGITLFSAVFWYAMLDRFLYATLGSISSAVLLFLVITSSQIGTVDADYFSLIAQEAPFSFFVSITVGRIIFVFKKNNSWFVLFD